MTRNRSNGIFQPGFLFSSNGGLPVDGIFPEESISYRKYVVRRTIQTAGSEGRGRGDNREQLELARPNTAGAVQPASAHWGMSGSSSMHNAH